MNIVMIMSGGVGRRFGAVVPKQYNMINGKPVIEYVVDTIEEATTVDKVIVVIDKQYIDYSQKLKNSDYDFVDNGETRFDSMKNGLDFINKNYNCQKLVIVDAVGPFIYADLIDDYFKKLDSYDAVITAQKITGGFTNYNNDPLNREDFIITQSPEGFNFPLLYSNFKMGVDFQETACMLPQEAKRYYNFNFKNNLKLTYDFELKYAEFMLKEYGKENNKRNVAFFDKNIFFTQGLKSYLLRLQEKETILWLDSVYDVFPELLKKWSITSFLVNQTSRFGLVLLADSETYGKVVLKFIPPFVNRYERELEAMQLLSKEFMCDLLDYREDCNCMLLRTISPAKFASFDENIKLTQFFNKVVSNARKYDESIKLEHIPYYFDELKEKLDHKDDMPYMKNEIVPELKYAIKLFEDNFVNAQKYIIHGDLHSLNILNNNQQFWGIDPNGMLAPLEFECVRFIRNDVRDHPEFGYANRFEILVNYFSQFVLKEKLLKAFIIDMAFCTYNSVFENETPEETIVDLKLIEIAKELLKKL